MLLTLIQSTTLTIAAMIFAVCIAAQKKQITKAALSIIFILNACILILYFVVDGFSANGIDRSFIYHVKSGFDGAGYGQYNSVIVSCFAWILIAITFLVVGNKLKIKNVSKFSAFLLIIITLIATAINPGVLDLYNIYKSESFDQRKPIYFTEVNEPIKINKKNIVYIYLESLERTFFDDDVFPGLLPNLKELEKKAISFRGVDSAEGGGWTIGGMVSSACGIPLLNRSFGNSLDNTNSFLQNYKCLGDILMENGYRNIYIGGANKEFSGKSKFYDTHGFSETIGKEEFIKKSSNVKLNAWGVYDQSVYNLALNEVRKAKSPYMIQLLTVETHHPDGIESDFCKNHKYGDGTEPMLNSIHCADVQLKNFIDSLYKISPDVLIVIQSDHLAMKNTVYSKLKNMDRENLFMVLNSGINGVVTKKGTTLDVLPTLLSILGSDVKSYGYGRSLLGGNQTLKERLGNKINDYLVDHISFYSKFWNNPISSQIAVIERAGEKVNINKSTYRIPMMIEINDGEFVERLYEKNDSLQFVKQIRDIEYDKPILVVDGCSRLYSLVGKYSESNEICYGFGALGSKDFKISILPRKLEVKIDGDVGVVQHEIHAKRLQSLRDYFDYGTSNTKNFSTITNFKFDNKLFFRSASAGLSGSIAYSEINDKRDTPYRGLTIYGIDKSGTFNKIKHMDTCDPANPVSDGSEIIPVRTVIERSDKQYTYFVVVSADSAFCVPDILDKVSLGSSLTKLPTLATRQSYLAILHRSGKAWEFLGIKNEPISVKFN